MAFDTCAEMIRDLHVPASRIRMSPLPGTATARDVLRLKRRHGILCELIDDTLVEKSMGFSESNIAFILCGLFYEYLSRNDLGLATGPDGPIRLHKGRIRMPDFAFYSWDRFPNRERPTTGIPAIYPDLAVEVISPKNTVKEMAIKLEEYFAAGTQIVWFVRPKTKTVDVFTSPSELLTKRLRDTLTGDPVLPGLKIPVAKIFA